MHTIFAEDFGTMPTQPGTRVIIEGDEATHAVRVKRVGVGEVVRVLNGAGLVGLARVEETRKGGLTLILDEVSRAEPVLPAVHVWSATPKGGRLDRMIDALAQVGAASWTALETARGVVDPRETKLERIERLAAEASKQSGRAWRLNCPGKGTLERALQRDSEEVMVVLADGGGEPYRRTGCPQIRLLIGPEGGWTDEERAMAIGAGATVARFGPHVMRVETAAVVGAGCVLTIERG